MSVESTDPRYIPRKNWNLKYTEQTEHRRNNNQDMLDIMERPIHYKAIIKYLKDPMLQDKYHRANSFFLNNKDRSISLNLKSGHNIRIAYEKRNVPSKQSPQRMLDMFVLYIEGVEVIFKSSQDKILDYISKELLKEPYREDKKHRLVNRE